MLLITAVIVVASNNVSDRFSYDLTEVWSVVAQLLVAVAVVQELAPLVAAVLVVDLVIVFNIIATLITLINLRIVDTSDQDRIGRYT